MTVLDALLRYPLFCLPPVSVVRDWLERGQTLRWQTGETIFQEGSPGAWAYILRKGRVRVVRRSRSGREVTLGKLGPGELFGEYGLLAPGLNTATCRAASDVELLQLPLDPVRQWIEQTPSVRSSLKNWLQLHFLLRHLRGQPFLGFMSAGSALAMLDHLEPFLPVPALRTVQADGFCDDRWFFLEEGEVLLSTGEAPVRTLTAGSGLGEAALLNGPCPTSAVALTPTRCLSLPREFFFQPNRPAGPRAVQTYPAENLQTPSRVRWIGQKKASDCGAASLRMLAHYFELPVAPEGALARVPISSKGLTLSEMLQVAQSLGLMGQAVRISRAQVGYVQVPAIAHLTSGHYVVLFRIDQNGILVGDPATGLVTLGAAHFLDQFSGYLLLLRPSHSNYKSEL